jgi:serine/threonine protein kinase
MYTDTRASDGLNVCGSVTPPSERYESMMILITGANCTSHSPHTDRAALMYPTADFGFARHLGAASMAETLCGSPLYMAPEILKFQKYDAKADLWSVGTILYEMVVGKPPYGGANHVQLLANIERLDLRFPPQIELSAPCKRLLTGLLQRKPANRMGFDEFFSDPFVGLPADDTNLDGQGFLPMGSTGTHRSSLSSLPPTAESIQEEEEDEDEETKGSNGAHAQIGAEMTLRSVAPLGTSTAGDQSPLTTNDRRARAFSASHDHQTPSMSLRNSRSGNMEVMQTVFGSTSSAGIAGLRRSSRLGRSRRSTSSGAVLTNESSPKLSPQMSPSALPSPSPRINPFKQLSESPPGAAALLHGSAHHHYPVRSSFSSSHSPSKPALVAGRHKTGGANLDTSGEYVLVESGSEKAPASMTAGLERPAAVSRLAAPVSSSPTSIAPSISKARNGALPPFSHENGQQVIDIVLLRTQAISPIAEQLWKLSMESQTQQQEARESLSPSAANLDSMFSMGSSLSSSSVNGNALVEFSKSLTGEDSELVALSGKKQYVFAAEALALYVKCLRLIQHGVLYLRQDPAMSKRLTSSPDVQTSPPAWSEASRKLAMAYLMEQLNLFLERADQCKTSMANALEACRDPATARELQALVVSQEELMYAHAIRLGKQGAIKEVLGQTRSAYDHYLQAMLLLESLLLDASPSSAAGGDARTTAMAAEDQSRVTTFLRALEDRLRNVKERADGAAGDKAHEKEALTVLVAPAAMIRAAGP